MPDLEKPCGPANSDRRSHSSWVDVSVELLRRLAGRLNDHPLAAVRSLLSAREQTMMTDMLLANLVNDGVALVDAELRLLDDIRCRPDPLRGKVKRTPAVPFWYYFVPDLGPQTDPYSPTHVLRWAACDLEDRARSLHQARRMPTDADAPMRQGRVYVLEVAQGSDVSSIQASVQSTPGAVGVEVVAEGENLPPYQAAALSAGAEIWRYRDSIPWPS